MNIRKKILICILATLSVSSFADNQQNINLLNKIGYGVTEKSLKSIKEQGINEWIKWQINNPNFYNDSEIEKKYDLPKNRDSLFLLYKNHDLGLNKTIDNDFFYGSDGLVNQNIFKRVDYALNSENRLREMMVWFWFNHFNIGVRTSTTAAIFVNDFETKIREKSLGKFKELLKMTMTHPAMLYYLDNVKNRKVSNSDSIYGINENYAREFLELHTMGVDSGYTQKDVRELARTLTGFGIILFSDYNEKDLKKVSSYDDMVALIKKQNNSGYTLQDFFLFQNINHDFSDKKVLGTTIKGKGVEELDEVISILCKQAATAKFISKKLALYFVNDNPSDKLIDNLSKVFLDTDGDISKVLLTLFNSEEFLNSLKKTNKFKDIYTYFLSTIKSSFKSEVINNDTLIQNVTMLLNSIEADPYFKNTPEGFSLYGKDWISTGRLYENIYFTKLLIEQPELFFNKKYSINYNFLSKIANKKISSNKEAVLFLTSEEWLKK